MYRNSWNKSKPMSYTVNSAAPSDLPVTPPSFTDMNIFQNDAFQMTTDNAVVMQPENAIPVQPESVIMVQPGRTVMMQTENTTMMRTENGLMMQTENGAMMPPENATMMRPDSTVMMTPENAAMTPPGSTVMMTPENATMMRPDSTVMMQPENAAMTPPGSTVMMPPGNAAMTPPGSTVMMTPENAAMMRPGNAAGENVFPVSDEMPVDMTVPTSYIPSLRPFAPNVDMPLGGPDAPPAGYSMISFPAVPPTFPDTPLVAAFPPAYPNVPVARGCNIRILHADKNLGPITVILSDVTLVKNLSFGNISDYSQEASGILLVTVTTVDKPFQYVVQETMRFNYGETYTIAIVPRGGGSSLFQINDISCSKSLYNSCMRAINLSPDSIPLDVSLLDGRTIARNLSFLDIGGYKQFMPGTYRIIVYENRCRNNMQTENQHPVSDTAIPIIIGGSNSACMTFMLASSQIQIHSNRLYTIYLIGYTTDSDGLTILFVESSF